MPCRVASTKISNEKYFEIIYKKGECYDRIISIFIKQLDILLLHHLHLLITHFLLFSCFFTFFYGFFFFLSFYFFCIIFLSFSYFIFFAVSVFILIVFPYSVIIPSSFPSHSYLSQPCVTCRAQQLIYPLLSHFHGARTIKKKQKVKPKRNVNGKC